MIQIILSIPAATDWTEVPGLFADAGYTLQLPPSGIMPSSKQAGGRTLMHGIVTGASYAEIETLLSVQRPVWQVMGAQSCFKEPTGDPESPEAVTVYEPLNASVWNFIPNRLDSEGNATIQQNELHRFQGIEPFPGR